VGRSTVAALAVVVAVLGACGGDVDVGRTIDWNDAAPISGEVVNGRVVITSEAGTHPVTVIESPGVGGTGYAVRGEVAYEDVVGTGYLEMWSHFADGGSYFSRTLDTQGPMAALQGDSAGREFELPLLLNGAAPPQRLEINVVLPEGGTVSIGAMSLVSLDDTGAWWDDSTAGLIGAVAGTAIGLLGAAVGILAGTGRARRFVVATFAVMATTGLALLVWGIVALAGGQPYAVYYPLLLGGGIITLVFGLGMPGVRRRYRDQELRRIKALDAR